MKSLFKQGVVIVSQEGCFPVKRPGHDVTLCNLRTMDGDLLCEGCVYEEAIEALLSLGFWETFAEGDQVEAQSYESN